MVGIDQTLVQSSDAHTSWWGRLSLSLRFLIVAAVVLFNAMAILGSWVGYNIEQSAMQTVISSAGPYLHLLEKEIEHSYNAEGLDTETIASLDRLADDLIGDGHVVSVKIWALDGKLLYSSLGREHDDDAEFSIMEVARAARGEVVATFEGLDHEESKAEQGLNLPLIEIYVPLYPTRSTEVLAVGEIYTRGDKLRLQIDEAWRSTWLFVGTTFSVVLLLLFFIVNGGSRTIARQAKALAQQVREARDLAARNDTLRVEADRARLDANRSNEELLARIGADIHDGPVQMLSLLLLTMPEDPKDGTLSQKPVEIGKRAIAELRTISAGLVLPEIEAMHLDEALRLAISRHEQATGTLVHTSLSELPDEVPVAVKTCLYRVVQEGLSNTYRHARGAEASVSAWMTGDSIFVRIADDGPGLDNATRETPISKLGLTAMRTRIEALRGSLAIESTPSAGVKVTVSVPIHSNLGQVS